MEFCPAAIKSIASAASKVNTEYHGDCRQLKDWEAVAESVAA